MKTRSHGGENGNERAEVQLTLGQGRPHHGWYEEHDEPQIGASIGVWEHGQAAWLMTFSFEDPDATLDLNLLARLTG